MGSRKPTSFIVGRHLLTHPEDGVADIVRHTTPRERPEMGLDKGSVSKARRRLLDATNGEPTLLLKTILSLPERPRHKEVNLHVADAIRIHEAWHSRMPTPHWWSGELAAAELDGVPLMPAHVLVYVRGEDLDHCARFTIEEYYGRLAQKSDSNFTIRARDPWLYSDVAESGGYYVEKGQRLIDYRESKNVHLLKFTEP